MLTVVIAQRNLRDLTMNARINWEIPWAQVPARDRATLAALDSDRHGRGFSHGFLGPKIAAFRTGLLHEAILRRYAFSEDG